MDVPSLLPPTNGISILVKPLQPLNAELPIVVTLLGIVTLVKLLQPLNAEDPMLVAPFEIITSFKFLGTYVEL